VSSVVEEARSLIDTVAEAIDAETNRRERYMAGREIIVGYYEANPRSVFAVGQASKYLLLRVRELVEEAA